jgi:signal transduction histidine kinase
MSDAARPTWLDPQSLTFRLIVTSAILCAVALLATFALLTELFERHLKSALDTELVLHIEELAASVREKGADKIEVIFEREPDQFRHELSGHYWQVSDAQGILIRSRSLWDARLPAPLAGAKPGSTRFSEATGPRGEALRLAERVLNYPASGKTLTFSVGEDMAPIVLSIGQFNRILALALTALGLCLVIATIVMVRFGLRPLSLIGGELARIRTGQGRYLEGRLPSEIQPLAVELNALVDHHESLIKRARAQAGDLAHALKTPLAVLRNEIESSGPLDRDLALSQLQTMSDVTQRHLARAQAAGSRAVLGARSAVRPVVEALARTLPRMSSERPIAIDCELGPRPLFFAGEEQDLQELLGVLMENACKWAKSRINVTASLNGQRLNIAIGDDGPGIPPEKRAAALSRGGRLDEGTAGSGLGLAIALDLAQLYQGTLTLGNSAQGGLLVELNLPAA